MNAESGSPALRRPIRCRHSHNQENAYMSYTINRMISDTNIDDLDVRDPKSAGRPRLRRADRDRRQGDDEDEA